MLLYFRETTQNTVQILIAWNFLLLLVLENRTVTNDDDGTTLRSWSVLLRNFPPSLPRTCF